jgi:PAS domain S-box-containing protein
LKSESRKVPTPLPVGGMTPADTLNALRQRAEGRDQHQVVPQPEMVTEMAPRDAQLLVYELRLHQVELEMQNEDLRRAHVDLNAARERYFDLYDMAPVGYCTVSEAGRILEANLTAATMLGVTRSALAKRLFTHLIHIDHRSIYRDCCRQVQASGQTHECDLQMVGSGGTSVWVNVSANLVNGVDGTGRLRVTLKDVSERVRLEADMKAQNAELERTRLLAEKASSAKSDFLASMSHELRSPLNAILGFAQLMETSTPAPTPAQKASIDHILHAGWHLLDLVNEVLELASIESGQTALAMAPVALDEVLSDCEIMITPLAATHAIQVSFAAFAQPCFVQADRHRLRQVMTNLLSNAIKYNRQGGAVDAGWSLRPHGRVRISVRDSGCGLAPEQLGLLFQPFNRLGQALGALEGTGIGLVVSKRLVEMMGGTIGAHSTVGQGSIFWFELALAGGSP